MKSLIAIVGIIVSWAVFLSANLLAQAADIPEWVMRLGSGAGLVAAMAYALRYQSQKLEAKEQQIALLMSKHETALDAMAASHKAEVNALHDAIKSASDEAVATIGDLHRSYLAESSARLEKIEQALIASAEGKQSGS